eukprot:766599-Hanusia_phi.AAC.1
MEDTNSQQTLEGLASCKGWFLIRREAQVTTSAIPFSLLPPLLPSPSPSRHTRVSPSSSFLSISRAITGELLLASAGELGAVRTQKLLLLLHPLPPPFKFPPISTYLPRDRSV